MTTTEPVLTPCPNCKGEMEFKEMAGHVRGVECRGCGNGMMLRIPKAAPEEKKQAIADAWKAWCRV